MVCSLKVRFEEFSRSSVTTWIERNGMEYVTRIFKHHRRMDRSCYRGVKNSYRVTGMRSRRDRGDKKAQGCNSNSQLQFKGDFNAMEEERSRKIEEVFEKSLRRKIRKLSREDEMERMEWKRKKRRRKISSKIFERFRLTVRQAYIVIYELFTQ